MSATTKLRLSARLIERGLHVLRAGHRLGINFENDIAPRETALCGIGISRNAGHHDTGLRQA